MYKRTSSLFVVILLLGGGPRADKGSAAFIGPEDPPAVVPKDAPDSGGAIDSGSDSADNGADSQVLAHEGFNGYRTDTLDYEAGFACVVITKA